MKNPEKFWDRLSKNYDKKITVEDVKAYQSYNYLIKYLNDDSKVLDFGCAKGTLAFSLEDKAKEIHGIDLSSKMIQMAQAKSEELKITNTSFSHLNIFDGQLKHESYDMVLSFNVLHLLEDVSEIIQRIHQLLKPGGFYVSLTPCVDQLKVVSSFLSMGSKIGFLPHINRFKTNELVDLIEKAGFNLLYNESLGNNPLEHFIIGQKV